MILWVVFALTAAQIAATPEMSVSELVDRHVALNGQLVRVSGWMGRCEHLGCALLDHDPARPAQRSAGHHDAISIGAAPGFDERAGPLEGHRVTIMGWFNDSCWTRFICTDRAPDLRPLAIAPVGAVLEPLDPDKES